MNDKSNTASGAATSADGLPDIRRRSDGSIDIEYYESRARRLRSSYITNLFVRLVRCWRRSSVHLELQVLDERTMRDIGISHSDIPAIVSGAYFRDDTRRQRDRQTDSSMP
jgi:uncharacterized protein YjiS (DUF1127 family)